MDKIQENTKIEKAILAEKQQIFLIQNKLSEIEKKYQRTMFNHRTDSK